MPFVGREEELRVTGLAQRYGYDNAQHLCFDWLEDLHELATGYRPPAIAARPWQAPLLSWLEGRARYPGNNATIVAKRAARGEAALAETPAAVAVEVDADAARALARLAAARGETPAALLTRLLRDLARLDAAAGPAAGRLAATLPPGWPPATTADRAATRGRGEERCRAVTSTTSTSASG